MQLRTARLCLDCDEVHEAQQCPICASESFAYLSRWIDPSERRQRPRTEASDPSLDAERLEAVKLLTKGRVITSGVVGITTLGILGWMLRRGHARRGSDQEPQRLDATNSARKAEESPTGSPE